MSIISKGYSKLDDKECFDLWVELGTLKKVGMELVRRGKASPTTGKAYTGTIISKHASRWAIENPEEAREIFIQQGSTLTQEQWERWMVERATTVYHFSPNNFFRWIERNDFEKYEAIYIKKFGTLEQWRQSPKKQGKMLY